MATINKLNFTESQGKWTCDFVSLGDCVIQIARDTNDILEVSAYIGEMPPFTLFERGCRYSCSPDNVMMHINLPVGVNMRITSMSRVTGACLFIPDQQ